MNGTDRTEQTERIELSRREGVVLRNILATTLPIAERLDRARGDWCLERASGDPGKTPGTNYAVAIQELLLKLEEELGDKWRASPPK